MEGEKKTMRASERHDWLHFCRDDFGAVMDFRKRKKEGRKEWGRLKPLAVMAAEATPIFGFELPPCC